MSSTITRAIALERLSDGREVYVGYGRYLGIVSQADTMSEAYAQLLEMEADLERDCAAAGVTPQERGAADWFTLA